MDSQRISPEKTERNSLMVLPEIVYVGERGLTKESQARYKIYLPKAMNPLWEKLKGHKVQVYIITQ